MVRAYFFLITHETLFVVLGLIVVHFHGIVCRHGAAQLFEWLFRSQFTEIVCRSVLSIVCLLFRASAQPTSMIWLPGLIRGGDNVSADCCFTQVEGASGVICAIMNHRQSEHRIAEKYEAVCYF